ncbi:hypothetical protein [Hydrogenimonas sp. SS33]|uniref:hypothetical protein n=1 Tax=Hydrogenimonas leucolamina TaxID=2954236 RepID=UPI00336C1134
MKKSFFSLAAATLLASSLSASITLYQDTQTGALYTKPGPNRVKLGEFVSKEEIKKNRNEAMKKSLGIKVDSGVAKLKFNGTHYLGYHYTKYDDDSKKNTSRFETRRNYFQVKGYWDDSGDYVRLTLDTFQHSASGKDNSIGSWEVRLKYAYLYLNLSDYFPHTGVEFGQVHRPWIDYAEHHGWLYRAVSETFVETGNGAHIINSAAPGINFKTKTDYFSSEIGLFNNAGYHGLKTGTGQSFEWRLTGHLLGTGKKHVHATQDEWLNVSFFGRYLTGTEEGYNKDNMLGVHAVYNRPMFLIGGYYLSNDSQQNHIDSKKNGDGWSVNGEFRPADKWSVFARYDDWTVDGDGTTASGFKDYDRTSAIYGVAYTYNRHVKFILNGITSDTDDREYEGKKNDYMATAEVHW